MSDLNKTCRVGESWTSTFPTFHLLLFCVIAALRGALRDTETEKEERVKDGQREKGETEREVHV